MIIYLRSLVLDQKFNTYLSGHRDEYTVTRNIKKEIFASSFKVRLVQSNVLPIFIGSEGTAIMTTSGNLVFFQ